MEAEESESGVDVSRRFQFATLCAFLDRIRHIPKSAVSARRRVFNSLIARWSADSSNLSTTKPTFYPALRLIANAYDSRKFNMKSKKLIAKVCKALLLPNETKRELLKIDSKSSMLAIAQLAREIADRNPSSRRDATIFEVNESLDKIMDAELSENELNSLLRGCRSARELFWLMNILVRNVERCLGIASSTILNWVHENGNEMRKAGASLEKVCQLAARGESLDASDILFRMFEPMLLSRIKQGSNIYDKLVQYCGEPFYVELKFDGEHFMVHRGGVGQYRYYSRNQNDFSEGVGRSLNDRIEPFFASTLDSCVLDTELLLWDTVDGKYVGKGRLASDGRVYDVKSLKDCGAVQACLAIFDVLFLNGRSLMDIPLERRKALLNDGSILCKQDSKTIFIADFDIVNNREHFIRIYEKAMKDGEEGIVVKKIDSVYKIGVRHMINGWFKVKPFHLGDESLDLAVVGVDRGRNGFIESYVVAVIRDDKFFVVGKTSRGLDHTTRKRLNAKLEKDHGWLNGRVVPDWIHAASATTDRATDYAHKDNIQVVEVRAAGIINGRLQFPSLRFYRDDKFVKDTDKYEDFLDYEMTLRSQSLVSVEKASVDIRKRAAQRQVMDEYRLSPKKAFVPVISTDLQGKQVCVLHGSAEMCVQRICEIVESFGGSYVANPRPETVLVLTGDRKNLKAKAIIKSNKYNVVSTDWIARCADARILLPVNDSEAVHIIDESLLPVGVQNALVASDNETEESFTIGDIQAMLDTIHTTNENSEADEEELRNELLRNEKFFRFSNFVFFLDQSLPPTSLQYTRSLLKMHAAKLSASMDEHVTHIVVDSRNNTPKCSLGGHKVTLVDMAWIEDALEL
uniref:DNA ligase IV n=1 Tax=Parascaris univalens TaxID=6257 RepID=A0A915C1I3_PARUN